MALKALMNFLQTKKSGTSPARYAMECKRALCISALLLIFNLVSSFDAIDTITTTQRISDSDDQSLVSTNENFKLGFFSPGKSRNRYVGIWLNKVHEQTVVWVANRENPIKNTAGIFKIGEDGNLGVFDGNERSPLWSTNFPVPTRTARARLLDSGNLILVAENLWSHSETVIWQSFDYPTNTILPGMKVGVNIRTGRILTLTAWKSSDDPAAGEFSFSLDPQGSPQLFMYKSSVPRWRCGPWNGRNLNGAPDVTSGLGIQKKVDYFNQVDLINYRFVENDNEIYFELSKQSNNVFSIAVMEPEGILKRMIWHGNKKWNLWMAPKDLCDQYARCGPNAICSEDSMMHCACLPGFEPFSPQDWNPECVETRKKKLNGCGKGKGEGFVRLESVKIPDARSSTVYSDMSLYECEKECLKNCNCTGYASKDVKENGQGCIAWYGELVDMSKYKDGQDFYLRVDAVELAAYGRKNSKSFLDGKSTLAFFVVTLVLEVLLTAACFYYWIIRGKTKGQKKKQRRRNILVSDSPTNLPKRVSVTSSASSSADSGNIELTLFDLSTLTAATNNFSSSNKLGQGGFGPVYMGQLPNGQEIAIKRLSDSSQQGIMEFKNEVLLIAKLQHRNLVKLLGYCIEDDEMLLIYEFMLNKSLDSFIFDESRKVVLDWKKRMDIILGIARGIVYLHEDSRLKVIHRDLKASNILLDAEMKPRISDFGTARLFGGDQTQANTSKVVGTFGYMSPEYALGGLFSTKSDVFSFGVVLLEIISGKKNRGFFHDDPYSNLIRHTWQLWRDDRAIEIVDSSIAGSCPADEVLRCIQVGLLCVQDDARRRPTMSTVIFMLSNETPLPSPKQSTFGFRRTQKEPNSSITGTSSSINEVTMTTFSAR